MVDQSTVCCMCGDVGFPDKLFRCSRCRSRLQHPYCSNYYEVEGSSATAGICDWCRSEERNAAKAHWRKSGTEREESIAARVKGSTVSVPAANSKVGGRRYKLLKDVLC